MGFHDILASGQTPGEDGIPETIWDELAGAYDNDVTIRDAAVAEKDAALVEALAALQKVQAHNYELLMAVAGEDAESDDSEDADDDSDADSVDSDDELDNAWTVKEDS